MSDRREFLKKAIGGGASAGVVFCTARLESFGRAGHDLGGGAFERGQERLVAEVRMSPRVRIMARRDPLIRDQIIEDALQVIREAMENDDGTNPPII